MNVFKTPITDIGKKSKKGMLTLEIENGQYVTKEEGQGIKEKVCLVSKSDILCRN